MSLLSDEEIMVINQTAEFDSAIGYARKIESAILDKLKAQEPVAYVVNAEVRWNTDKAPSFAALYFNPIPADDVVRQRDELLAALQYLVEAILTRADADYMKRQMDEAVRVLGLHGIATPVPYKAIASVKEIAKF